jgi:LuxR family transcriptional regulator
MTQKASIAALLHQLDERSPAGFAIALHIRFTTPTYMFQTYAKRWLDHYTASGLVMQDPVVRWGMQNEGRIRWADLEALYGGRVMEEAKDFGLMNGAAIAIVQFGSRSVAGFARADRDYSDAEMVELEDLLRQLHQATLVSDGSAPATSGR